MFSHPQLPFGYMVSGEAIKSFAAAGHFTVMSFEKDDCICDIKDGLDIPDESEWIVCLDAAGEDDIAIFRCIYEDYCVMSKSRMSISAYTTKPEMDDYDNLD